MKVMKLLLLIVLTIYAPVELTRFIIISWRTYYPDMAWVFIIELSVMWLLYCLMPVAYYKFRSK